MADRKGWNRREFLTGAGVAIGLPFFQSLFPKCAWAEDKKPPVRMLFMSVPLGFVPELLDNGPYYKKGTDPNQPWFGTLHEGWFPKQDGGDYKMPAVHAALTPYREHISFLKGLHHPKYRGDSHYSDDIFLTGADTLVDPSRTLTNTISCDQVAAKFDVMGGNDVRYRSLALGIRGGYGGSHTGGLSWSETGVPIAHQSSPALVFDRLFGKDDLPLETRLLRLKQKKSILDATLVQIQELNRKLNATDRTKLDELLTAVQGVETQIQSEEHWANVPKPNIELTRPDKNVPVQDTRHARIMFDLIHAAFLTDSTRVITYEMPDIFLDLARGFDKHNLAHAKGEKAQQLSIELDTALSTEVARWVKLMTDSKDHDGQPLLYHTVAAYGSACWGATHGMRGLPVMLIGQGGGKVSQGQCRTFSEKTPLSNAWLTMLKAGGVPVDSFSDSTGVLEGVFK